MTANSQFISGKGIFVLLKRCLALVFFKIGHWGLIFGRTDTKVSKRIFDILFSLFVLVFFAPVYLAIALLIFLSSPRSDFLHSRTGRRKSQNLQLY